MWRLAVFVLLFLGLAITLGILSLLLGAPRASALSVWSVGATLRAALGASVVAMRVLEGRPTAALGLALDRDAPRAFAGGAGLGLALIGGVVATLWLVGWLRWIPEAPDGAPLARAAGLALLLAPAALTEELLFRGYPLQALARRFGGAIAIGATSVTFAGLHAANPNAAALPIVNIGLAGVVLGLAYWRTYSLWFASGVHFGWNWTMAVSDLSVSGLELGMPAFDPRLAGPPLWTGGEFGPEGGLLVTLASLVGIAWLWRTGRLTRNLKVRALGPLPEEGAMSGARAPGDQARRGGA